MHRAVLATAALRFLFTNQSPWLREENHDFHGAIDSFQSLQEAPRLDPDNPWVHFKLGYLYHSEGNLDAAIREYRTTIHLKPDAARPHLALGRALKAQGKKQEGAEEMMAYLMLAEKNPANKPLIERTDKKLRDYERQGIKPTRRTYPASR